MAKEVKSDLTTIDASPVKSFFVEMLTRDIRLEDSILDLLDNCVDGILRGTKKLEKGAKPFKGYRADITFDKHSFSIEDNCGGIPWDQREYALRMGRSKERGVENTGSVGVYGIGMKRALFKIGEHSIITTQNSGKNWEVEISPDWIKSDSYKIPVRESSDVHEEDGTTIVISALHPNIRGEFSSKSKAFERDLMDIIETHYALIIDKGFEVKVNGVSAKARSTKLIYSDEGAASIKPFIYQAELDGVQVFVTVGFTRPIPSSGELDEEQVQKQYSTEEAGWTVICNDRAVVYCDRTELTGWGDAGVPRYHTQFIAISGVVEFRCEDPSKLPTTTTKRGINANSRVYQLAKNKMREGTLCFTRYTNKWKGKAEETKEQMSAGTHVSIPDIKKLANTLSLSKTAKPIKGGTQFVPKLPAPKEPPKTTKRISFVRKKTEIEQVAGYLFDDLGVDASDVGNACFEEILKESR